MPVGQQTLLDLQDPPAEFYEQAKVKYRETPEFVNSNLDQLRNLVTGKFSFLIYLKVHFLC